MNNSIHTPFLVRYSINNGMSSTVSRVLY